jgi:RNA polymerase sigma-70 factor (ECF subfamily)
VYRIAHNLITDRYRRGPRPEAELDETLEAADDDPAEAAAQRIAQARARAALWKLTTDQRQVILLKYFEGLSNDEVAAALDKPVGAIKSLQHRALDSMRRVLAAGQIGELI